MMKRQNLCSLEVDNNLKRLVSQNCLLVTSVAPASTARNLGVLFDPDLKFDAQITKTCIVQVTICCPVSGHFSLTLQ